jgi:hypothetical protein
LNPEWLGQLRPDSGEGLSLDCPVCGPKHRLAAYFSNPVDGKDSAPWGDKWKRTGESFSSVTVAPSLQYPCFHGWIESGLVFDVSESPLTVPMQTDKGVQLIALSPDQAFTVATGVLERLNILRANAAACTETEGNL